MPEQFNERIKTIFDSTLNISNIMRNVSSLAIHISPLILLYPKKLDGASIRRDALIAVSMSNCCDE